MNRTTTIILGAIILIIAAYAAVQYSGRMSTQPTENPTPPASTTAPVAPPATDPVTPPPSTPSTP
ncbi:hypothetical protein [Ancylobacter radicis]|uniref:Dynamin n=1 Tax=Ancylobacter radicis TaxID=2836179 RepID=A0ABS5RB33_9HYPH|nr:hypothetical protein [Ancylobacter radicis]MBS9478505.1 hypothetical protein [Ancylobacter radicis]